MAQNRIKKTIVQFWTSADADAMVRRIAEAEGRSVSAVYRDLVEKGLVAGGYLSGSQDLAALVRNAVEDMLRPSVERLAAISAKGTQISAAAFFLAAYSGRLQVPEALREEFDNIATQARKLGVEYLKLSKERNLDDFIAGGLARMEDSE